MTLRPGTLGSESLVNAGTTSKADIIMKSVVLQKHLKEDYLLWKHVHRKASLNSKLFHDFNRVYYIIIYNTGLGVLYNHI